jgi:hypothetical protein
MQRSIMRMQPALLALAGLILAFATFTHGSVVVPHLREDLVEIAVRPTLLNAVLQALNLGVLMLAAVTLIVLVEAFRSYRGLPVPRASLAILGIALVVIGVMAFQVTHSHHALGYALIGALLLGAVFTK